MAMWLCAGFGPLVLFLATKSPPKTTGDFWIFAGLLGVAILGFPLARWLYRLLSVKVVVSESGISTVRGDNTESFFTWSEIARLSYSRFNMRLVLHSQSRDRRLAVEKQVVEYERLRDVVLKRTGLPIEVRWW
jgi:hypothetical protein